MSLPEAMHASRQESAYSIIGGRASAPSCGRGLDSHSSFSPRGSSHQSKNCFTARAYRQARVAVTNRRTKELDEAAAGPLAHDADNRRQRLKLGTDQYGGGCYFVGQHDPVMASTSTKRLPAA